MRAQTQPKNFQQNPQVKKKRKAQRSLSDNRLLKLQKIGFQHQAQKIRKENGSKHLLREYKMNQKSSKKLQPLINYQIGNFLYPTKIIAVTAHKWAIYDFFSAQYIRGYRARDQHQLSVFSKLLVFCAVNTLVEKYKIDITRFETIVSQSMLKIHNENCQLKADDIVSLQDLLHLMIMSQSQVYQTILAVNVGVFLEKKRRKQYYSVFDANSKHIKQHLKLFYDLVNSYCKLLKLENIRYLEYEPQLRKQKNKCSAADVAVLSIQCLKIPFFMEISSKLRHRIMINYIDGQGKLTKSMALIESKGIFNKFIPYSSVCRNWGENSFMDSHCSIYYQHKQNKHRPVVVVLLGCYGPADRQKDIQQIIEWYFKHCQSDVAQQKKTPKKISASPTKELLNRSQVVKTKISRIFEDKLQIQEESQLEKKYGPGIKFKSKNVRIKTQI